MRILITNDDGYDAKGLAALKTLLQDLGHDVISVAPKHNNSAISHKITLIPIHVKKVDDTTYIVDGTPADCVSIAIKDLFKDSLPDLVISGINRGANLGMDVIYSGTVAAAREAALHGIRAIAVSSNSYTANEPEYWSNQSEILRKVFEAGILDGPGSHMDFRTVLNINLPNVPVGEVRGMVESLLGTRMDALPSVFMDDPRGQRFVCIGTLGEGIVHTDPKPYTMNDFTAIHNKMVSYTYISAVPRSLSVGRVYDKSWDV